MKGNKKRPRNGGPKTGRCLGLCVVYEQQEKLNTERNGRGRGFGHGRGQNFRSANSFSRGCFRR